MLSILSNRRVVPLGFIREDLIVQKGMYLGKFTSNGSFVKLSLLPENNFLFLLFSRSQILRRLLRLEAQRIFEVGKDLVLFYSGKMYVSNSIKNICWSNIDTSFKGSRILNPGYYQGQLVVGEYFGNKNRQDEVRIARFSNNQFTIIHEFAAGEVRHVHGCKYDSFNDRWLISTGDLDHESNIYELDSNDIVTKIIGGSQKYRVVDFFIESNGVLILPSDTPLEQNFIRSINLKTHELNDLHKIEGSAFHCAKINGIYFVSTVTEPSEVNNTSKAYLYCSNDGSEWIKVWSLEKDIFPVSFQKYTRYTELRVLDKLWNNEYLVFEVRAAKLVGHGMIYVKFEELKNAVMKLS